MEIFWFFWLQFHHTYDSAYRTLIFLFSLDHKHSNDSAYASDSASIATENLPN